MADAFISIARKTLTDVVSQELSLFAGATHEFKKLSDTFQSIQAVLDDAESRQAGDQSVKLWLSRLRHAAYDIQDLLEDGLISGLGDEEGNKDDGNCINKLCLCFPLPCNPWDYVVSRYGIARDIKEIRERLDQIADEKNKYGFSSSTQGRDRRELVRSQRLTTSLMNKSEMMIGRKNDKKIMISRLVSGSNHEDGGQAHVVAIFGIGGLGKTTLAREIYNDSSVQDHFKGDLYWVCVSEVFDVIRLTEAILEQVRTSVNFPSEPNTLQKEIREALKGKPSELDALQKVLLKALRGKRFLLVLDDIWNHDAAKWKMLRLPLNSGAPGSRILVTTRDQKVAQTMNATYIHELQGLSDDHSWEVFRSRAFTEMAQEECSKLENVGRQIVSRCRGVPLAITVMGSAMNTKRTMADWQNVLDSKMWSLRDAQNEILPVLWLSYYNLPSQLKQCLVYCSIFPKDWVLEKDMLVRLWVAQGFIRSDGNRDIEDIGAGYFDDLVACSMLQEVKENSGKITWRMHDLFHDLAESIAKDENYTFIKKSEQCPSDSSKVRHSFLFFTGSNDDMFNNILIALGRATKLRTLFLHRLYRIDNSIVDIFRQARFIRALVFSGSSLRTMSPRSAIVELSNVIGDLKHLRYLDLSGLDIVELPESVSHLRNLHTLNLSNCGKLEKLPRGIGGMVSLRHLEIERTRRLKHLPKGLGRISGLRSLCKFIVGGGDEGEGCRIDELQPLNSLQGTLYVEHLERVSSREEAEKAELWNKQYLCRLVLEMSAERHDDAETGTIDSVLEGLRPHENLEQLEITGFTGSKLPSWMDGMRRLRKLVLDSGPKLERAPHLPSLKKFQIESVRNELLPDEGWEQLVALQELHIHKCIELKCLPEGLTQLPSLENLEISSCDKLESLPEGLGQLKKLKILSVAGSKVLTCLPNSLGQLASLESLCIWSCEKLESLPVSLGQLKKLNSLSVNCSEVLRCLPDWVGQLESLKSLRINSCKKLESLPASLGQLKKLESLYVRGSEVLTCLPDSVGQLESLKYLYIPSCKKLKSLPVSLGQLKILISLEVGGSEVLTCLPDWIGQLESLERLFVSSCKKLESLPVSLGHLKVLKSLVVSGSEVLRCLPDSLGQLESLKHLEFYDLQKLESLPHSLVQLKKLESLMIGGLEALRCVPDWVGQLESLKRLFVRSCKKLESLPDSLGQLKALNDLEIKDCEALASLPESLGQLKKLNFLVIEDCEALASLPESLGQLKELNHLAIKDCKALASLPESWGQLKALNRLVIKDCKALASLPESLGQLSHLDIEDSEALSSLPRGLLRHLSSLFIKNCPLLWERNKREGGVDWPNISHIRTIRMNGELIR